MRRHCRVILSLEHATRKKGGEGAFSRRQRAGDRARKWHAHFSYQNQSLQVWPPSLGTRLEANRAGGRDKWDYRDYRQSGLDKSTLRQCAY